jgi:glycosyltransferase involved in cell wall biosynthesis
MMSKPSTAAVVATFNQQDYIAESVTSLASQVDEVIVVDDASTDETPHVLRSLSLSNLRSFRNDSQLGVSHSFNRAVAATTAEILIIQGGDDRSLPGRVQRQVDALADPGTALVHSVPIVIDSRGQRMPAELAAEFLAAPEELDALGFLFFAANYICAPSAALRRADYVRLGGFRGGLDLLQDYALWLDLAATGRIRSLGESVVEYRKHGANLSREYVGPEVSKRRRLAAERGYIRNRFLRTAEQKTLNDLANYAGLDAVRFQTLDADARIGTLQLAHSDKLVLRRGLDYLFEIAAEPDSDARFARLGLSARDIDKFAIQADHDNLEDVGRAIGAVQKIREHIAAQPTGYR